MPHVHGGDHHHTDQTTEDGEREPAPGTLDRRGFVRGSGLLGAVVAGGVLGTPTAASATTKPSSSSDGKYLWLAGDHHIHTQYSPDAMYRVADQVRAAAQYGLGWMVITDHGTEAHAKFGVEAVNPDIRAAREDYPDTLVYQGLEWNIPGAEHATVFVAPGDDEVAVLKEFENGYDGSTNDAGNPKGNEKLATDGLKFLDSVVRARRVTDALMLANHPSRKGIDSPHEVRDWRDAAPEIAIGMEGAPGHQAAGIPAPGPAGGRGGYGNDPGGEGAFPGYPAESYRTFGGFDWMTATVGGFWDSLLAEGLPWWITANSDSHKNYADWVANPVDNEADAPYDDAGHTFNTTGRYPDPVYAGGLRTDYADFWPGAYSRTYVGATGHDYRAVMEAMRAGRIWVSHGGLIAALDLRVRAKDSGDPGTTLGGSLAVSPGTTVEVVIRIRLADQSNFAQFVPKLARVDLIAGDVTGPVGDRDAFTTPRTKVVESWDTTKQTGEVTLRWTRRVEGPTYVRVRGTDGRRSAPGLLGARIDPAGPAIDKLGDADPWEDLWFYSNPVFVVTTE